VYYNLGHSNGVPELQTVQRIMSVPLAQYRNNIYTLSGLFERIDSVYKIRFTEDLKLNQEQIRLIERFYLDFVRAGALFTNETKTRYAEITVKLADLTTQFDQVFVLFTFSNVFS
jgi:peptidyl-dipeptidase Dcp